jgi:hypothetical protein
MSDVRFPFIDRRTFFRTTSALAAASVMPRILAIPSAHAQAGSTMVIAAPATPQSLDCNFDVSLGTFEAIGALYDGLLGARTSPSTRTSPVASTWWASSPRAGSSIRPASASSSSCAKA